MVGQLQPVISQIGPFLPRKRVRAVWMRAGTSKGLFLHKNDLPDSQDEWAPIILSIMGSRLGDPRQLDGLGGATSTTSKVVLVEKSSRPGIDVEYTFVQVSVTEANVDLSGNCGNMASGVGPFALDEGLVKPGPEDTEIGIRIFNTNTNRVLIETVAVSSDGTFEENGDYRIAGVKGTGSPIKVSFLSPAGSMTGKLFPTGNRKEIITVHPPTSKLWARLMVRVTLIDCANPFVLVEDTSLPTWYHEKGPEDSQCLELVEKIRREGSVRFGLTSSIEKAASIRGTPKIAVVSSLPSEMVQENNGEEAVLHVTAFSMGKVHPSLQLTGAVCIGMSLSVRGTVSSDPMLDGSKTHLPVLPSGDVGGCIGYQGISSYGKQTERRKRWKIKHGSGEIEAEVTLSDLPEGEGEAVESIAVFRTARRLFEGSVLFH